MGIFNSYVKLPEGTAFFSPLAMGQSLERPEFKTQLNHPEDV